MKKIYFGGFTFTKNIPSEDMQIGEKVFKILDSIKNAFYDHSKLRLWPEQLAELGHS